MAKLFMLLIGCLPKDIEQHDVYFGIGENIREVLPEAMNFWPEAKESFHLDAWREVTVVNDFYITITEEQVATNDLQLYFINLGGYKKDEFEEFHYKMLAVAPDKASAIKQSKQTAFFKHTGFKGATAHIDDKYGVDVDDIFTIREILPGNMKEKYNLLIRPSKAAVKEDELFLGYFRPSKIGSWAPQVS